MALDAAHRSSIYEKLRHLLGDEDANVLMSEFPAVEADELVTKDFLRAELALTRSELHEEMADFRGEMRGEMANLRGELRGEMVDLRGELRGEIASLRIDMASLENRLTVRLGSAIAATAALLATIGLIR